MTNKEKVEQDILALKAAIRQLKADTLNYFATKNVQS